LLEPAGNGIFQSMGMSKLATVEAQDLPLVNLPSPNCVCCSASRAKSLNLCACPQKTLPSGRKLSITAVLHPQSTRGTA